MEYELRFRFTARPETAKILRDAVHAHAKQNGLTNFSEPQLVIVNRYEKTPDADELHDVILTDCGPKKINVIKTVRAFTSLGLKEAKDLVDSTPNRPRYILKEAPFYEASRCLKAFEEDGAKAVLERSFIDQAEVDLAVASLTEFIRTGQ